MSEIMDTYRYFKITLPERVKLVAVSKTKPREDIMALYNLGHRIFGENKVQDLVSKAETLPSDIQWHMIGHLQSNKVKYLVPFVSLIHSVDSIKLLETIEKEGAKRNRRIDCLLQVHIALEETKFGFSEEEVMELVNSNKISQFQFVNIRGLMGMATFTEDMEKVRQEFRNLKTIFENIRKNPGFRRDDFSELSMGMSGDYPVAIEEGSTMIRIGSLIFGERNYH
ncbi:MAG: YggS family pyridoxal phosphate-dependent enzyme [Bacteroidales bacterium]|nr:YggS family pyridoxal phosphate-dependent enzyme [Bacteroidales bacterium]